MRRELYGAYSVPLCFAYGTTRARELAFEELMSAAEILGEYEGTVRYSMEGSEDRDVETARKAIRLAEQVAA